MNYQVALQSRDRDQRPFVVEVAAETGDEAAALALARHPGHIAYNIFPAADATVVEDAPTVSAVQQRQR